MIRKVFGFFLLALLLHGSITVLASQTASKGASMVLVIGAPGEEEYGQLFLKWANGWKSAASQAGITPVVIGKAPGALTGKTDRELLQEQVQNLSQSGDTELWVVLIGHGTFDGKEAKFNLEGPDVSADDFVEWFKERKRPLVFINTSSASAPFLAKLSGPGRVVITATRSGHEVNFARFGGFLSQNIASPEADLDKDGQTSLLEAFLLSTKQTEEFYEAEDRLATEHPLLDDNGDGQGTPGDWFRGVRAVKRAESTAAPDGRRAHQVSLVPGELERKLPPDVKKRRDELELEIEALRDSKPQMSEEEYYEKLKPLLIELARLYEQAS